MATGAAPAALKVIGGIGRDPDPGGPWAGRRGAGPLRVVRGNGQRGGATIARFPPRRQIFDLYAYQIATSD
jgi:hypothetical protein